MYACACNCTTPRYTRLSYPKLRRYTMLLTICIKYHTYRAVYVIHITIQTYMLSKSIPFRAIPNPRSAQYHTRTYNCSAFPALAGRSSCSTEPGTKKRRRTAAQISGYNGAAPLPMRRKDSHKPAVALSSNKKTNPKRRPAIGPRTATSVAVRIPRKVGASRATCSVKTNTSRRKETAREPLLPQLRQGEPAAAAQDLSE